MKKTLLIVSVAVFGLSFGCGGGKDAKDKPATAADTAAVAADTVAAVPDTATVVSFEATDSAQSSALEIIRKDYNNEKHGGEFHIYLENVGNSDKIYNLINKLIYDGKNFDEYIEYTERDFIKAYGNNGMLLTGGGAGLEMDEKNSIICNNDTYIIFEYHFNVYTGGAHNFYGNNYIIIDLTEEKILGIDELISPIPDDILDKIIKSNSEYDIDDYFRDNIWPPDAINFCNDNIELLWNPYTLSSFAIGQIIIEVQDKITEQYLTDKGKTLREKRIIYKKK